ncbi:aromatic aminobenezylarsenical efflux permease ArsG family transporter [Thermostilla marina]
MIDVQWFTEQGPALGAFGLGLATALAPCPMATNVAAISYIGRRVESNVAVLVSGVLYTLGRAACYIALAFILAAGLTSLPGLSLVLRKYGDLLLGPVLILLGMVLVGLIKISLPGGASGEKAQKMVDSLGIYAAFPLGIVFALAFCPTSAAYFGGVVALVANAETSPLWPSLLYGVGTGLPVLLFALVIAFAAQQLGKAFNILTKIELAVRYGSGVIFILIGIYFVLRHNFALFG